MDQRVGIIGHPVAHSLSPVFQQAALDEAGLDITYELWDTPGDELADRVSSLRSEETLGANVTIPHKEAVVPLLDELDELAARIGAVNTIVNRGGVLHGYNTDGRGFLAALKAGLDYDPQGENVLLLGAGGAARGIAFAMAEAGTKTLAIWNRTATRAEKLAADVAATGPSVGAEADLKALARYDCIVNCTSVGMDGTGTESESPCDISSARNDAIAVDIVYKPAETRFLRGARARGMRTLPGLPMLIHQGALAFEHWTGRTAPLEIMTKAAEEALAAEAAGSGAAS